MPSIKSLPVHKRPREKLVTKGPSSLTEKELLAILLRTGHTGQSALDIASNILKKYKLTHLLDATLDHLQKIKGIDIGKATTILAAFELTRRAIKSFDNTLPIISSTQDVLDQLTNIRDKKKEYFVALYLNARNELIHKETISIGTLTESLVHPREVFEPAITHSAVSIILAHNHPSGNIIFSEEDILLTKTLVKDGELLSIPIQDHILVTKSESSSLNDKIQTWQRTLKDL